MTKVSYKLQSDRDVVAARRECTVQVLGEVSVTSRGGRLPLAAALVLDNSGSMHGRKIEQAREACRACTEMAERGDALSLVSFASTARVLASNVDGAEADQVRRKLDGIRTEGGTHLHGGILQGMELLENGRTSVSGPVPVNRRLVLATDGQSTNGPRSPEDFEDLARRAAAHGITIDTFGIGRDYNEAILASISRITGGNHRYVDGDPAAIVAGFKESFRQVASTGAREAVTRLLFHPRAEILEFSGISDYTIRTPRQVEVRLGDLDADPKSFSCLVRLTGLEPAAGLKLAVGELDYLDLSSGMRERARVEVVVSASEDRAAVVASVKDDVNRRSRLIHGMAAVAAAADPTVRERAAAGVTRTLKEAGMDGTDLARKIKTIVDGGPDATKTLREVESRVDAGRTVPMTS